MNLLEKLRNYSTDGPAGNDLQFLPLVAGIMAGGSIAASAYGGWKANKDREAMQNDPRYAAITPGQVQQYMSPVQQQINAMGGTARQMQSGVGLMQNYARQMQDPTSAMNLQQRQMMGEQGASQLALQALLSRRQAADTGMSSGILSAQQGLQQQQLQRSLQDQYQNQMMQNRMSGMNMYGQTQGLLGNIAGVQGKMGGMQMGIQENIAQADISGRNQRRGWEMDRIAGNQAMWSGLGSGLMGATGDYIGAG